MDPDRVLDTDDWMLDVFAARDLLLLAAKKADAMLDGELADLIDAALLAGEAARAKLGGRPAGAPDPDEDAPAPERNGTHGGPVCPTVPVRKLVGPPPPVRKPGDATPPCLAGMRSNGLETAKRLAALLVTGPRKQASVAEALGMTQQGAAKLLAKLGGDLPPGERLVARDLDGRFALTPLGRKWLLGANG